MLNLTLPQLQIAIQIKTGLQMPSKHTNAEPSKKKISATARFLTVDCTEMIKKKVLKGWIASHAVPLQTYIFMLRT